MSELINAYTTTFQDSFANLKNGTFSNVISSGRVGETNANPISITGTLVSLTVLLHTHKDYDPANIKYLIVLELAGNNTSGYVWTMVSSDLAETSTELVSNSTITPLSPSSTIHKLLFTATSAQTTNKGRFRFSIQANGGVSSTIKIHQFRIFEGTNLDSFNNEIPTNDGIYEIVPYETIGMSSPYPNMESRTSTRLLRDSSSTPYESLENPFEDDGESVALIYTDLKRPYKISGLDMTFAYLNNYEYFLYGSNVFNNWKQLVHKVSSASDTSPSGEYTITNLGSYTNSLGNSVQKRKIVHDFSIADISSTTGAESYFSSNEKYRYYKIKLSDKNTTGSPFLAQRKLEIFEIKFLDNDGFLTPFPSSVISPPNKKR